MKLLVRNLKRTILSAPRAVGRDEITLMANAGLLNVFLLYVLTSLWRSGGLPRGSSGPDSSPCCVLRQRHFTLRVPLNSQVSKWVLANINARGSPAMD